MIVSKNPGLFLLVQIYGREIFYFITLIFRRQQEV